MDYLLGIDIGGTTCAACLGTADGEITDRRPVTTRKGSDGWRDTVDDLLAASQELVTAHAVSTLAAIGISCGSPMAREAGIIQEPANLPGWCDVPIVALFRDRFAGVPTRLENDADAGALAELAFGAGRDRPCRHMLFLTFGTGLGAGIVLDGRLHRGASNYAGEIGHIRLAPWGPAGCGKAGSFEGFCSGGGIAQIAHVERRAWFGSTCLPTEGITTRDVGLGAAAGDALCHRILELSGEYLGRGLAIVVDLLNPELIVIGSVFARCEPYLRPAMERALAAEARPEALEVCEVVPATLGERIGDWAALSVALLEAGRYDDVRLGG